MKEKEIFGAINDIEEKYISEAGKLLDEEKEVNSSNIKIKKKPYIRSIAAAAACVGIIGAAAGGIVIATKDGAIQNTPMYPNSISENDGKNNEEKNTGSNEVISSDYDRDIEKNWQKLLDENHNISDTDPMAAVKEELGIFFSTCSSYDVNEIYFDSEGTAQRIEQEQNDLIFKQNYGIESSDKITVITADISARKDGFSLAPGKITQRSYCLIQNNEGLWHIYYILTKTQPESQYSQLFKDLASAQKAFADVTPDRTVTNYLNRLLDSGKIKVGDKAVTSLNIDYIDTEPMSDFELDRLAAYGIEYDTSHNPAGFTSEVSLVYVVYSGRTNNMDYDQYWYTSFNLIQGSGGLWYIPEDLQPPVQDESKEWTHKKEWSDLSIHNQTLDNNGDPMKTVEQQIKEYSKRSGVLSFELKKIYEDKDYRDWYCKQDTVSKYLALRFGINNSNRVMCITAEYDAKLDPALNNNWSSSNGMRFVFICSDEGEWYLYECGDKRNLMM